MKRLIITGLLAFLISTTFLSDNPPGWYQLQFPVNKQVSDIFFLDSLNGWTCTNWDPEFDSAYIVRTTNGGSNWEIQLRHPLSLTSIQFIDKEIGYSGGGDGSPKFLKTTNGGINWNVMTPSISTNRIVDLKFINKDTGWVCSNSAFDGGIFKTTNGGVSWQRQTTVSQLAPVKLFFLNQDTGWALSDGAISKTINGGNTWGFLNSVSGIERDLFFLNNDTGWVISADGNPNGIIKTTNGGVNWFVQKDPAPFGSGPQEIHVLYNSKGWISCSTSRMLSLYNYSTGGNQTMPSGFNTYFAIYMVDTSLGYSGGRIFVKTDDGGGIITNINENSGNIPESFILHQNYPNPFNPKTIISYELGVTSYITLKVFNIQGKELKSIVNQRKNAGSYKIEFDGSEQASGVYFYKIEGIEENSRNTFSETKKMILTR
jgi:photosystem II stability/assembly factor-like uncharacterized protein